MVIFYSYVKLPKGNSQIIIIIYIYITHYGKYWGLMGLRWGLNGLPSGYVKIAIENDH